MPSKRPPKISTARLRALRQRLKNVIRDAGFGEPNIAERGASQEAGPFWAIEPTPLVIDGAEWSTLEAGLRQRARVANAYLVDAYDRQEVLRQGLLPPEVLLGDPFYRRQCLKLEPERDDPATVLRFDLVKTPSGWRVVRTRANTPASMSYAVQARRLLTQEASEFYDPLPDYHSIINLPLQLLDTLQQLAPSSVESPSIVVLTAGPHDPFYTEHSFLARKMGLPLAQGDDLLVIDNRVFFKTISGLEPVDVIYRRLNDAYIDPVVFPTDRETAGVAGLIQSIRAGKVVVANAIGTGVAESRALDVWLPRLTRFYLGESPLLPSVQTYTCGDNDHVDYVLENRDSLRILPIHDRPPLAQDSKKRPPLIDERGLADDVRLNPFSFVAQELTPGPAAGARREPIVTLSAFVLTVGRVSTVIPGGLVHLNGPDVPVDRVGVTTDAVVLRGSDAVVCEYPPETAAEDEPGPLLSHALGSRTAEGLFWLGRYLERAETTARMLSIIGDVALEEIPARERRVWLPLWQGILEATGHGSRRISARDAPAAALGGRLYWRMTLDSRHQSSILSSVRSALMNVRRLRDFVSPEAWYVLHRLAAHLDGLRHHGEQARWARPKAQAAAVISTLNDVNAFLGTADRTMLHDAGWRFLTIGLHLERVIMICSALRHVLGEKSAAAASADAPPGPRADNPELSALLRMLGSQDAYRRLYRNRSRRREVADFFLRSREAPRSLHFNLRQIEASVSAMGISQEATEPLRSAVAAMIARLNGLNPETDFEATPPANRELGEFLSDLLGDVGALHRLMSDHHFSHQAHVDDAERAEPVAAS